MGESTRLDAFLAQRKRLLRLAYRHLATVSDAEDVVQEAWLRFSGVAEVEDPAKLLSTIVTRLCLDRAKSAARRREVYVGEWLPEPAGDAFEAPNDGALDISFAVMRTLEQLSPGERAAYFLHDLWDMSFDEIAPVLARSPATCRQLASRARQRLADARARFHPSREEIDRLVEAFRTSVETGDPTHLKALLAAQVEFVSDGGGKAIAARNVLRGAEAVSRFLMGVAGKNAGSTLSLRHVVVNDHPALLVLLDGIVDQTFAFDLDPHGQVAAFYLVRNPDKLGAFA